MNTVELFPRPNAMGRRRHIAIDAGHASDPETVFSRSWCQHTLLTGAAAARMGIDTSTFAERCRTCVRLHAANTSSAEPAGDAPPVGLPSARRTPGGA